MVGRWHIPRIYPGYTQEAGELTNSETGKEERGTRAEELANSETGIGRLSGAGSFGIERASLSLSLPWVYHHIHTLRYTYHGYTWYTP